ncbi:unnamed protein product [Caenorhabditis auriculariae]|uniref:Uncharacterized protein n=1 Tax=Caenorhabditis auriculariae TaxID=2777116 RepID=A0A8S1H1R6_9PELO|nr:unnamed protein product [Caenorhabditis auriculariae]
MHKVSILNSLSSGDHALFNIDQSTDASPRMKWNRAEGKLNLRLLLMIPMLYALPTTAIQSCCKKPIVAYSDVDAIPPECRSQVRCTDAMIYADHARSRGDVSLFLTAALKTSTITLIGGPTWFNVDPEEIVHKGPGPAITLVNVSLVLTSFTALKSIEVPDVSIFCNGRVNLIEVVGKQPNEILNRLYKVGNATLKPCKSWKATTQASALGATQGAGVPSSNSSAVISRMCTQKTDAEEEKCSSNNTLLYIACGVIVVLLIVSVVSTIIALKPYLCRHKKDLVQASLVKPQTATP